MNKLHSIIALLVCFVGQWAFAQRLTLNGQVTDANRQPVPYATVTLAGEAFEKGQATDSGGRFAFSRLNSGMYHVRVSCVGFSDETLTIDLNSSQSLAIRLKEDAQTLEAVVVTGQYEAQSTANSVYRVRVVDSERIAAQGAVTLKDVLTQELNVRLSNDMATGTTSMSLQGISGQNVKVLIDGVPLVGVTGNEVDLGQVNVRNVERIEIVEGPMSVAYGSNALGGVINVITKKDGERAFFVNADLQEESVGSEYGTDQGLHNQALSVGGSVSDRWYLQGDFVRNDFDGFQGAAEGRQRQWNPKEQYIGTGLVKYSFDNHSLYYRLDYLNETITAFGSEFQRVEGNRLVSLAQDEEYVTDRFSHQVQAEGRLPNAFRYHAIFAYTDYQRRKREYTANLTTGEETLSTAEGAQDTSTFDTWAFRGTVSDFVPADWVNAEVGYDINLDRTGGGRIRDGEEQRIDDYGFFASAEFDLGFVKVRPGVRYAHNSVFASPVTYSVNLKADPTDRLSLRAAYGRGFRAPTLRELYFEFVDANHNVLGNEDLNPERSHNWNLSAAYTLGLAERVPLKIEATGFYNKIEEMIGLVGSADDPTFATYRNITRFETLGTNLTGQIRWKSLKAGIGGAYVGRYNFYSEQTSRARFLYSPEANANLTYEWEKLGLSASAFYKFTGKQPFDVEGEAEGEVVRAEMDEFHWLDLSASKSFGKLFTLTVGVKNLLDVTQVRNTASGGGAHSGGAGQVPVGYGRSGFVRLRFHFEK